MTMEMIKEAVLSSVIGKMIDKMVSEFTHFFNTQKMDMTLLEKLKILANTASGVLDDAEHKQFTAAAVKTWLVECQDAAYEAVVLLDLISCEATAAGIEADQRTTAAGRPENVFTRLNPFKKARVDRSTPDVAKRMVQIVARLGLLLEQIEKLGLEKSGRKDAWPHREPTTSVVDDSNIVGRDAEREAILNFLQEDGVDGNAIGVIPIVGMGGIGKTTLAQLVYNHSKAQEFESRAWVCVSDNYDGFRIKKELLKQVNDSVKCDELASEQIDVELKKSLKDKKYVLVLDDIWDDGYDNWDRLQAPLKSGARGSKIIITTRDQTIASKMGTVASGPCELRELDALSCWQLFAKHAFKGGKGDERLESIGTEIVSKCKGLPLAAKMLGDLLQGEHKVAKWEAILKSDLWELRDKKVLPALILIYQHLPSHLKQCFAYCAIFPKDYRMSKEEIIQLWMAEGFLVQPIRGKKMEELGEECFEELMSRSFLQESFDTWGDSSLCMHDLINDLAQHISGEFIVRMEEDRSNKIGNKTRHFSVTASNLNSAQVLESISGCHTLRTFLCLYSVLDYKLLLNQILKLRCLRVLSLRSFYEMVELPDQIGDLKLLRYLDLAGTSVERLPDSVCTLYNLQTLILRHCSKLVELPKNIGSLINLHCLDIRKTWKLQEMPRGMGNLKELRTLGKFVVGKQNGSDINELGKLHLLQGELSIYDLQNVVDTPKDILKNKNHLEDLILKWSSETEESEHERRVLEGLQPYTSINKLSIFGYGGTKFADWIGDSSYANIVSLGLHGCNYCTSLPPLELSSLERLSISDCGAVVEVSMKTPLCSLKTLFIKDMSQWEKWIFCEGNDSVKCGSLAKLEELTILGCPALKSITTCGPTHEIFKSLHKLAVMACPNLKTSNLIAISNFRKIPDPSYSLNFSKIADRSYSSDFSKIADLSYPKDFSCLSTMRCLASLDSQVILKLLPSATYDLLIYKPEHEKIEEMGIAFDALENIEIRSSELCECIPLEEFPKLKSLSVEYCHNLKSLSASEASLHRPLNSLILQSLVIRECNQLIGGRLQWGLQRLNALSRLSLCCYKGDDLDSFPEETLLPSTLTSLEIKDFPNLKVINYKGLQHLTSLAELKIRSCLNLQCLPEEGLPSSLSRLYIWFCPLLKERCEREIGEDWPKISHISDIRIR